MIVTNFEAVKEQFILDVNAVVEIEDIPPELVFNWDQTGISVVSGSLGRLMLKDHNEWRSWASATNVKLQPFFVVQ